MRAYPSSIFHPLTRVKNSAVLRASIWEINRNLERETDLLEFPKVSILHSAAQLVCYDYLQTKHAQSHIDGFLIEICYGIVR